MGQKDGVQRDYGALHRHPGVIAVQFIRLWNVSEPDGRKVCVYAFVDDSGVYLSPQSLAISGAVE
jgi:hypothetical protein